MDKHAPGIMSHSYWLVEQNRAREIPAGVIEESSIILYVNGQELATIMCSPLDEEALAVGFLYNEGVINSMAEVSLVKANVPRTTVDVFLRRVEFEPPRRIILTSGCGGGITLQYVSDSFSPLDTTFTTTPDVIFKGMRELRNVGYLYKQVRGVHTSVLYDQDRVLVSAEDVGRHNTIDKIAGKALQSGIGLRDRILLTSGRISSEMLTKARRMEIPVVASHTSPTGMTVRLAQVWQICVIGYARRDSMRVYTHPLRLGLDAIRDFGSTQP